MNKKTPENVALAKERHAVGHSLWHIANHFGIHENTAGMWVNDARAEKHRVHRRADYKREQDTRPATTTTMKPDHARRLLAQLKGQPVRTLTGRELGVTCTGEWAGDELLETTGGPRPLDAIVLKQGLQRARLREAIDALRVAG
jgi:hypothetical protein